jgi:hypothetical protein
MRILGEARGLRDCTQQHCSVELDYLRQGCTALYKHIDASIELSYKAALQVFDPHLLLGISSIELSYKTVALGKAYIIQEDMFSSSCETNDLIGIPRATRSHQFRNLVRSAYGRLWIRA